MQNEEIVTVEAEEIISVEYEKYGLTKSATHELLKGLPEILKERQILLDGVDEILAMDINNPLTLKKASDRRKAIKLNKTQGLEKWRKSTKEVPLRMGQLIDAVAGKEIAISEFAESRLMGVEKHHINLEIERKANLQKERYSKVLPYIENQDEPILSEMEQDVFDAYFLTKKTVFEAKVLAEQEAKIKQIENERLDKLLSERRLEVAPFVQFITENSDLRSLSEEEYQGLLQSLKSAKIAYEKEQEQLRVENEKLKKEAEDRKAKEEEVLKLAKIEKEKELEIEREKLRKEEAQKELLRKELQAEKDRELARLKEIEEKEATERFRLESISKAGDKAILSEWLEKSFSTPYKPLGLTSLGITKHEEITQKFESFKAWATKQIES